MRIKVPGQTIDDWVRRLTRAGRREIGGVLFGEQVSEGTFRIVAATNQRFWPRGSISSAAAGPRRAGRSSPCIGDTENNPRAFNYLGEWHSHPNAAAVPSLRDELTMFELLEDQRGAVNFLVLIIVRIAQTGVLEIGARTYLTSGHVLPCEIEVEGGSSTEGEA